MIACTSILDQLSVKLWSDNAEVILQHLSLLPGDNLLWDIST